MSGDQRSNLARLSASGSWIPPFSSLNSQPSTLNCSGVATAGPPPAGTNAIAFVRAIHPSAERVRALTLPLPALEDQSEAHQPGTEKHNGRAAIGNGHRHQGVAGAI